MTSIHYEYFKFITFYFCERKEIVQISTQIINRLTYFKYPSTFLFLIKFNVLQK